ncbi:Uncharacterized protein SAPIO_CDS5649 [Scedosporium apiospermum]|uniref:TIP41-like protein n=1 Tax=Pseudallescheria apiosperma TaxID=563466 RepID=A0A084G537_PSEDA|nr:Uncharacterized protein SAPIO_CDS5649 [Scedosporium apiospermum]KEZ42449.1 Uncharacterized protein SAPIO_CDS5649 [Scedosporium apiospermum]
MEPPPPTAFPSTSHLSRTTKTHTQHTFQISTRKLPISKAGPISTMEKSLGIPVPEMIFGDNLVRLAHLPTGWSLSFNAYDALDAVGKTAENMLQVAYAKDWASSRENSSGDIKEVVNPYDWSYSSTYSGTLEGGVEGRREFERTEKKIPLELLKRRDPILFSDEVFLYESELDDNGISVYSVKLRVHEKRMLLLARLFVRVDNVIVRIRDTRVYVDFEAEEVIKEHCDREDTFANVKRALLMTGRLPDAITASLRDPNILSPLIPIKDMYTVALDLKSS